MWQIPVGIGVGILYSGQSPRRAVTATGITLAASAVIRSIGWRAVGGATLSAGRGIWAVSTIRPPAPGPTAVGYLLGAVVGTGVSYALFGEAGAKAAVDFYTDPFDLDKAKTIAAIPSNLAAITQGNRAVENNAAGLPTGTNVSSSYTAPGHEEFHSTGSMVGNENLAFW